MPPTTNPAYSFDKNEVAVGSKSRREAVFAFLRQEILWLKEQQALRTRIYVDGYNLYYGCLKRRGSSGSTYKAYFKQSYRPFCWKDGSPASFQFEGLRIKYFTAPILKNFAKADDSVSSQFNYHEALRNHIGEGIQVVEGYYDSNTARAHRFEKGKAARECDKVEIWKLEEKQSDVALAVHMVADALQNQIDHVVVVTNDTDIVPALQLIRAHTTVTVGLIVPAREAERRVNADLQNLAHWTRSHILDEELAAAQLPPMVRSAKRPLHKPLSWYPRPDLLGPIFEEAKRVRRSPGAAWKWLNEPCERLGGRTPISMSENDDTAAELRAWTPTQGNSIFSNWLRLGSRVPSDPMITPASYGANRSRLRNYVL